MQTTSFKDIKKSIASNIGKLTNSSTQYEDVINRIQKLLADRTVKKIVIVKDRKNEIIKIVGQR